MLVAHGAHQVQWGGGIFWRTHGHLDKSPFSSCARRSLPGLSEKKPRVKILLLLASKKEEERSLSFFCSSQRWILRRSQVGLSVGLPWDPFHQRLPAAAMCSLSYFTFDSASSFPLPNFICPLAFSEHRAYQTIGFLLWNSTRELKECLHPSLSCQKGHFLLTVKVPFKKARTLDALLTSDKPRSKRLITLKCLSSSIWSFKLPNKWKRRQANFFCTARFIRCTMHWTFGQGSFNSCGRRRLWRHSWYGIKLGELSARCNTTIFLTNPGTADRPEQHFVKDYLLRHRSRFCSYRSRSHQATFDTDPIFRSQSPSARVQPKSWRQYIRISKEAAYDDNKIFLPSKMVPRRPGMLWIPADFIKYKARKFPFCH